MANIEINRDIFKEQVLAGMTIPALQKYWACGKGTIIDRKKRWGLKGLSPNSKPRDVLSGTIVCKTCEKSKPLDAFYSNGYTQTGKRKYKPSCKVCEASSAYILYVDKIESILEELGLHYACVVCGYAQHPAALQFHHTTKEKNFKISNARNFSRDKLLEEIMLCDVLCANCHAIEHTTQPGFR